jgi:hypothetical protein
MKEEGKGRICKHTIYTAGTALDGREWLDDVVIYETKVVFCLFRRGGVGFAFSCLLAFAEGGFCNVLSSKASHIESRPSIAATAARSNVSLAPISTHPTPRKTG